MRLLRMTCRVALCLLGAAGTLGAAQPLCLDVSPVLTPAPGFFSVRAKVESNDENRALEIVAESPDYVRSSTIQLDGSTAPPLSVFEFRNLPPGVYDVTGVLMGTHGRRAAVRKVVQIIPTAGWHHR